MKTPAGVESALLFDAGLIDDHAIAALERADGTDWKWARGARLLFQCTTCGRSQCCAPPSARGGVTAQEAADLGWHVDPDSGWVLCPEHNDEASRLAISSGSRPECAS